MNPVDHPHGGGEGKTSGGRCSVTPWGLPTKGYKTKRKKEIILIIMTRSLKKGPFFKQIFYEKQKIKKIFRTLRYGLAALLFYQNL